MKPSSLGKFFTTKPKIGFIGLGNMGAPMVRNLLKKQYHVNGFDIIKERVDQVVRDGAQGHDNAESVARNSDAIIAILPNSKICKEVFLNHVFDNVSPGTLLLDCSTNGPITAKYLYEEARKRNLDYMDAPVTGAVPAAMAGALCFLVGAPNETLFEKAKEILSPMAKTVYNCKAPGAGQTAKICNNGALALQMIAVSNALVLGEKMGMDPKMLSEIMGMSSARCWSLDVYNPVPGIVEGSPSSRDYERGFATTLMIKDIRLVLEAAEQSQANVQFVQEMKGLYEELVKLGYGEKDFSYIYQYLKGKLNE